MIDPTALEVSGRRFTATYTVRAAERDVEEVARWMAGEMTVEFPLELIPPEDGISRHVVGRVESITPATPSGPAPAAPRSPAPAAPRIDRPHHAAHRVEISIADEVVAGSLTQLLSVIWGNVSLGPMVDLWDVEVGEDLARELGGPQHGISGLREAVGATDRPLLMSAVKPLGLPVERLASMAAALAAGGLDVVKEDQSLAGQRFAPFVDRIGPIAEAVAAANQRAGTSAIYAPSLNGPTAELAARSAAARDAGAGAVMVQPGISGYPALEAAAAVGLPVIAHPGGFGGLSDRVSPHLVFGLLPRLAGADIAVFITPGGRFDVAQEDADAIVAACRRPLHGLRRALPAAGGGITVERVPELRDTYGDDLCLLIGGDLHRHGDPRRRAAALRAAAEAPR